HWLITGTPATPTVAEALQARIMLPPTVALLIAVDAGQTLASLHDAGAAHGGLSADNVVLSGDGRVVLAESGYAHALAGTTPGPGHDTTAWVKLLRTLATPRPSDEAKRLLNAAADEAEALGGRDGLRAALTNLSNQAIHQPGYGERSALAMLASMVPTPVSAAPPPVRLEENETVPVSQLETQRAPQAPQAASPQRTAVLRDPSLDQETLKPAQLAAQMDQRKEEVLRFGRGVAALPQPQQQQQQRVDTGWGELPQRPKRQKPWRTRIIGIISGLVTLVLIAWVGYQIIQRLVPLRIGGATVALSEPLGERCDVQARVIGTIRTNGAAGTIQYRWVTSDGKTTSVLAEQVNLGTDQVPVSLLWTFSGRSTIQARATLHILSPSELEASTEFTYSCR
ncbi:MAG TPA: hypothetical protein VF062_13170, partial [Candidatus Limnocylindrales bacterium]